VSPLTATIVDTARSSVRLRETLSDVESFIRSYIVLSPEQVRLITLWIAQTYVIEAFDYVAYLNIKSPLPECGKTRLLEVLEALVQKPWLTGRVTAAVLMRKVHAERPVLLLDESDAAFGGEKEYAEALRGMLNTGFHRSGKATACAGQGANLTYQDFSTFGPKAIAGIGRLPSTIESRSIPIELKRKTKSETVEKWRRRDAWAKAKNIRDRLGAVAGATEQTLKSARPQMPAGLSDRAEDVLEPLFALADLAGESWPECARAAATGLMGQASLAAQEADQSIALELLTDVRALFEARGNPEALASAEIVTSLVGLEDRPWASFTKGNAPITPHRLAWLLRGFGVQPAGTIRVGERVFKGYRRLAFVDAFARYLPSEP
jgi:hypothetical protein